MSERDEERRRAARRRAARTRGETQVREYEASGGTRENSLGGRAIVIVTSTGAKSGEPRKFAVMRVEHEGEYAVVASLGGAPRNPSWYHNLVAHPTAQLQDGDTPRRYAVREVSGDEKRIWWDRAVEAFPPYADYQTKTDREIPLFVFTPLE